MHGTFDSVIMINGIFLGLLFINNKRVAEPIAFHIGLNSQVIVLFVLAINANVFDKFFIIKNQEYFVNDSFLIVFFLISFAFVGIQIRHFIFRNQTACDEASV